MHQVSGLVELSLHLKTKPKKYWIWP